MPGQLARIPLLARHDTDGEPDGIFEFQRERMFVAMDAVCNAMGWI